MEAGDQSEVVVQYQDFDVNVEYETLKSQAPDAGAIVFFIGLVRELYASQLAELDSPRSNDAIEYIELSHYAGMTEKLCQQIVAEARLRYPFDKARVVHRVGKLYAGEQIVLVAIASRHRDASFAAAQYIMDYLKTRAPIWKKEVGSRGEQWLGLKAKDAAAIKRWAK